MTGQTAGWAEPDFNDAGWTTVTVPHTWNVMPEYAHYEGIAWYRRHFTLPPAAQEAHLRLRFEAAFYLARVWLNGCYLGAHEGGYTPFEFNVSGLARVGSANVLAVRVDNRRTMDRLPALIAPNWSFDWWNYGGLVRDVALQLSSRAFIAHQRLSARPTLTAAGQAEEASVSATVTITNTSHQVLDAVLTGDVRDERSGHSALASQPTVSFTLPAGASQDVPLTTTVVKPHLWHFDHPYLYQWSVALSTRDGVPLHTAEATLGIRAIELRGARLYLNGEPVRLVGLTRHADSPEHGLAEPHLVMARDWAELKRLNAVFSRPVHYPQPAFILEYADRHGLLLIPELPAWQLTAAQLAQPQMRALARQQLREMITSQVNHPSVWAWSLGNEFDSDTPAGHTFVRELIDVVRELDPTRPVSFVSDRVGWRLGADATALVDFVMLNAYYGTWHGPKAALEPALDAIHATWPHKPVIISEYGFDPHWERIMHPVPPDLRRYYTIPPEVPSDSEAADRQRQQLIREQLAVFRRKPFIAGAIFWTYQDYRTRSGFQMGVVDAQRHRRGSWAVLREAYAPVVLDGVQVSSALDGTQRATVTLRARGPVERDLPAYTLREYQLAWTVTAPDSQRVFAQGTLTLPLLPPGTTWSGLLEWAGPSADYRLTLQCLRPTGFAILEHTYHVHGRQE
jgi:beta-glucuronidase